MKNVTVSLPDEVHRRARIRAAELDTSLSALVREYLMHLGQDLSDTERRKRLQADVLATITGFRAGDRMTRDQAHARDAVR